MIVIDLNTCDAEGHADPGQNYQVDSDINNSLNTVLGLTVSSACSIATRFATPRASTSRTSPASTVSLSTLTSSVGATSKGPAIPCLQLLPCGRPENEDPSEAREPSALARDPEDRQQTYLTDQTGRLIDLRDENLTVRFHHREV